MTQSNNQPATTNSKWNRSCSGMAILRWTMAKVQKVASPLWWRKLSDLLPPPLLPHWAALVQDAEVPLPLPLPPPPPPPPQCPPPPPLIIEWNCPATAVENGNVAETAAAALSLFQHSDVSESCWQSKGRDHHYLLYALHHRDQHQHHNRGSSWLQQANLKMRPLSWCCRRCHRRMIDLPSVKTNEELRIFV